MSLADGLDNADTAAAAAAASAAAAPAASTASTANLESRAPSSSSANATESQGVVFESRTVSSGRTQILAPIFVGASPVDDINRVSTPPQSWLQRSARAYSPPISIDDAISREARERHYDDFETIDWLRKQKKHKTRQNSVNKNFISSSQNGPILPTYTSLSPSSSSFFSRPQQHQQEQQQQPQGQHEEQLQQQDQPVPLLSDQKNFNRPFRIFGRRDIGISWHGARGIGAMLFSFARQWGAVTAVGVLVGLMAAWLDLALEWLSDLRYGICAQHFYLSRAKCCKMMLNEYGSCDDWHEWSYRLISLRTLPPVNAAAHAILAAGYAATSALFCTTFAPEFAPLSGIPELKTILGGFTLPRFLEPRTLAVKFVSLALSVASGLSIGIKAPLVHLAACIGHLVVRVDPRYNADMAAASHLLSCAAAAGIAVGFGSPIGGIIFVLEDLASFFPLDVMWMSFLCCVAATLTLEAINPFSTGSMTFFKVPHAGSWRYFELIPVLLIGALGGLIGALLNLWTMRVQIARKTSTFCIKYPIAEAATLALGTSLLGYLSSLSRQKMLSLLGVLFAECDSSTPDYDGICNPSLMIFTCASLLYTMALRFVSCVLSHGCRVPSGVFVPCMVVGACAGRVIGILVTWFHALYPNLPAFASCPVDMPCISLGSYALLGAAAVFTGSTRLTMTIVVILFELTGNMEFILPTIFTTVVAKFVADVVAGKDGFSRSMIKLKDYPFLDHDEDLSIEIPARNLMKPEPQHAPIVILYNQMLVKQVREVLETGLYNTFPVVDDPTSRGLAGCISRSEVLRALESNPPDTMQVIFTSANDGTQEYDREIFLNVLDLRDATDQTPLAVSPGTSITIVYQIFQRLGVRYVFVKEMGNVVGIITKKDIIRCVNAAQGALVSMDRERASALDIDPMIASGLLQLRQLLLRGALAFLLHSKRIIAGIFKAKDPMQHEELNSSKNSATYL